MAIVWTDRAHLVRQYARQEANRLQAGAIAPCHVLLGLLRVPGSTAASMLTWLNVDVAVLAEAVEAYAKTRRSSPEEEPMRDVFATAADCQPGQNYVGTEHILYALTTVGEAGLGEILAEHDVTAETCVRAFAEMSQARSGPELLCENCGSPASVHISDGNTGLSRHYCRWCSPL
ncbi:MAG: hypothetical protein JXA69_13995 [Phycisphaerae bacterium]|nr:hypothetical protein [Phycisphaerae bacterium]